MSYQTTTTTSLNGSVSTLPTQPAVPSTPPSPEATPRAKRRTFSADYKRRILREANQCKQTGQIGTLLRREGLYSSHLAEWRKQAAAGTLRGSKRKQRGRQPKQTVEQKESKRLQRENKQLKQRLAQAELLIEAQKKVTELLDLISQQPRAQQ